jgi:hypothetical protein
MFANSVAALTIASLLTAQTPVPNLQADLQAAPPIASSAAQATPDPAAQNVQGPPAQGTAAQTVTVPAGTAIPLTLMSVVRSKSTKPGDSVRAVVAFPVTVGAQLAIPAGTYVEGNIVSVSVKPLSNRQPSLRVHFTRLIFSNGYTVALSGENTQALLLPADFGAPGPGTTGESAPANEVAELVPLQFPGQHFAMGEGQFGEPPPTLPPLPQVGPPKGAIIGGVLGGFAAITIGMLIWAHHRVNSYDFAAFDVGWQFQMVLDGPVMLDAAQITAAAAAPSGT